jgi:2-methylcitrate dehydratase PrpD
VGLTEQLVKNVVETRFEDISEDVVTRAKDEVIDTIGCALGGANDPGSPNVVELVREWSGSEESTILAYGIKAPSHNVALANAVMARSFDYGIVDMCIEGEFKPAHIGETLVPTALAIAEHKALSGKQLLTALIAGEDLTTRIMFASKSVLGFDMTGTGNTLGATAVAGKLWGLDDQQWLNAFGIALNQMGGSMGQFGSTHSFKLGQGLAAQRGIFSVRLASKGFTAAKEILLGAGGYFTIFSPDYDPEIITKHLGQKYYLEVAFKPFPSCRGTHSSIECALEVVRKNHIKVGDIDEVTVIVNNNSVPPFIREPFTIGEFPHVNAIFSLEYTVANALLRGYPRPEHFTEEAIRDPRIPEMIEKIKITTQDFPNESFQCASIRIKTKYGNEFTEHVNVPKGNELEHPLTREEKREKFRVNASFCGKVNMKNAEKALGMMEKLEDVKDIREIVALLIP